MRGAVLARGPAARGAGGAAFAGAGLDGAVLARAGRRGRGRKGEREGAGLPQGEELLQPAEDAGEDGGDRGVDRRWQPDAVLPHLRIAAQVGELVAEGGGLVFHAADIN